MNLDVRPQMENGFFAEIYGADLTRCDGGQFDEIGQVETWNTGDAQMRLRAAAERLLR
jgi:hypothetical protein